MVDPGWTPEDQMRALYPRRAAGKPDEWTNALRRAIMLLSESGDRGLAPIIELLEGELTNAEHREARHG